MHDFRKRQLGKIARNRNTTGLIAQGEQDNAARWQKITHRDDDLAHQISARIVQFAREQGASILVFEHLGHLKPEQGKYSRRGNSKRAFWMKGRMFRYSKYKAWNAGMVTSRVNPRNTSRECARCHEPVARYCQGQAEEGYTMGAPLVFCAKCGMRGNADLNAAIVIGQRLLDRQGKSLPLFMTRMRRLRKQQVWASAKTPEGTRNHLFLQPGMQVSSGMAPPKRKGAGWKRP